MVLHNPLHVMITHICQGNIIPLQKGKPRIIVLKIQRFSHSCGHLVYKAEHAFISAGTVLVHQALPELQSQSFVLVLFYLQLPLFSVGFLYQ